MIVMLAIIAGQAQAGVKGVTRESVHSQTRFGMGHHVGVPSGHYEGVAVSVTRREAIRTACYANDVTKRAVSKSVRRGPNGMFYSSVIYRDR